MHDSWIVFNGEESCTNYNRVMEIFKRSADPYRANNGVALFKVPGWEAFDWLWHGFSTREGGDSRVYLRDKTHDATVAGELNLGFTAQDSPENVRENRVRFADAVTGNRETPLRTVRQIHSCLSVSAAESAPEILPEADGQITAKRGILIGVMTADCIPVLVADPVQRVVGAFHAGWRGTVERIVEKGIGQMEREFGSDPASLIAAIGPGIGPCCYTVGEEVRSHFDTNFAYEDQLFQVQGDQVRLNLWEANRRQLLDAGLPESAIELVGGCTSCQPEWFYSHRASGGHAGRMMAAIGLR
jgi:YfiH family protein